MDKENPLRVNLRIQVARDGDKNFYPSIIQDIEKNVIYIAVPSMEKNYPLILHKNERIQVKFIGNNEQYLFRSIVVNRKADKIMMLGIRYPKEEDITRIQLRNFYRLAVSLDVMYKLAENTEENIQWNPATALDISAGGLKLSTPDNIPFGSEVLICLSQKFEDMELNLQVKGKVVRKQEINVTSRRSTYHYGIEFSNITNGQRDNIVKYIFETTRKSKTLR